jgi:uncharacterized protein (TIGR02147 family)
MTTSRPDLFSTLDHRQWLTDWFTWKKQQNPRFSHRMFARLAGHKSPSLLLLVSQGKRNLTPTTLPGFIKATAMDPEEANFFKLLVRLDAAVQADERNEIFATIAAQQRFQTARKLEGQAFRYLSQWYLPAIRELATLPGFKPDPDWIAATLHPPIPVAQAAEALEILTSLGMLQITESGVEVIDVTIATPREVSGLAAHNYYSEALTRARDSITGSRPHERQLGAVIVGIPVERMPELKAQVAGFMERFLDTCESFPESATQVVQLGVQLFPLSRSIPPEDS